MEPNRILAIVIIALLVPSLIYYFTDKIRASKERIFRFDFDDAQNDVASLFISIKRNKVTQLHIIRSDGTGNNLPYPNQLILGQDDD